jgi:hypothetical protein
MLIKVMISINFQFHKERNISEMNEATAETHYIWRPAGLLVQIITFSNGIRFVGQWTGNILTRKNSTQLYLKDCPWKRALVLYLIFITVV